MNKKVIYLVGIAVILGLVLSNSAKANSDVKTVNSVNLNQYKGTWYEIAKFPNRFQKQCASNTMATYSLKNNGKIEVLNQCTQNDGKVKKAVGEAKVVDKNTNAKLKVRFAPGFLSFLPFVWGDYWILDLDKDYQNVLVGSPDRNYLWILSRKSKIDDAVYQKLVETAKTQGFDTNKLEKSVQK